ncbi:MAG: uncharacterized protein A8A55_1594 [Amphiamblys sp. WSBS2006]|nr:MAG: uncharacterized protein A8A55_1602 [Amphiamblys sp. WSBS2006]OIR57635.1 MAG: uncharacterized protein A8A55_1594 [Amphiamblys sp. WSBS2006]
MDEYRIIEEESEASAEQPHSGHQTIQELFQSAIGPRLDSSTASFIEKMQEKKKEFRTESERLHHHIRALMVKLRKHKPYSATVFEGVVFGRGGRTPSVTIGGIKKKIKGERYLGTEEFARELDEVFEALRSSTKDKKERKNIAETWRKAKKLLKEIPEISCEDTEQVAGKKMTRWDGRTEQGMAEYVLDAGRDKNCEKKYLFNTVPDVMAPIIQDLSSRRTDRRKECYGHLWRKFDRLGAESIADGRGLFDSPSRVCAQNVFGELWRVAALFLFWCDVEECKRKALFILGDYIGRTIESLVQCAGECITSAGIQWGDMTQKMERYFGKIRKNRIRKAMKTKKNK